MQRVYIHRNGKDILLTEQEMWQVYRTCKEFEEEQELELYKEFAKKGLTDIGRSAMCKNEKFITKFAEYMYRLVTEKDIVILIGVLILINTVDFVNVTQTMLIL